MTWPARKRSGESGTCSKRAAFRTDRGANNCPEAYGKSLALALLCCISTPLLVSAYWRKEIIMADMATAVVLVHGGFVDGSGWEDVYKILRKDGYNVSIVQNPTTSLADDVAATKRILAGDAANDDLVEKRPGS